MKPEERSIADYLEDIREIRTTMLTARDRMHVPPWFFFVIAALFAAGTAVHATVAAVWDPSLQTALLAIWLPVFMLSGVAEVAAWAATGRREGLPWMSRSIGRFFATIGGIMVAVVTVSLAALFGGYSPAGIVLIVAACLFHAYSPYSPGASVWIGWLLLAPGIGLVVAHVSSPALVLGAAAVVVAAFVAAGVAEARFARAHG